MTDRIYLDWNATAPLREEARAAMLAALELSGNASSVHSHGREARALIESAREQVASALGARAQNVVFTSGGTEANNLALTPALQAGTERQPRDILLVSEIEHASVRSGGCFPADRVRTFGVDADGVVRLDDLEVALCGARADGFGRPLVSLMAANNETGVVQPVREAATIVHAAGGLLHVDAVQAFGRMPLSISDIAADLVTVSAHKIGGPQGAGALVVASDSLHIAAPLLTGGGQERGLRAGTENVAAIAGFGAAAAAVQARLAEECSHLLGLRERLEAGLRSTSGAVICGIKAQRVPNTVLFAHTGIKAETALIALDLDSVAVSSGSACSSGKVAPSHVLAAMGVAPELARGAIRVSFGYATTESDIDRFLRAWRKRLESLPTRHGIAA
jgi:cysteine desulfurase